MSALKAIYSIVTTVVLSLATYVVVSTFVNLFETKGRDCYLSSLPCLTYELMLHDDCGLWRVIQQGGATAPIAGATTQPTRGRISFATRATALGTLPACAPMVKGLDGTVLATAGVTTDSSTVVTGTTRVTVQFV